MLEFHKPESTFTSCHPYQGKSQTSIKLPWYLLLINTQRPLHLQGLPQVQMWNSFFPNHGRSSAAEVPEMKRDLQPRVSGRFSFTKPPSCLVELNPCPLRGKLAQAPGVKLEGQHPLEGWRRRRMSILLCHIEDQPKLDYWWNMNNFTNSVPLSIYLFQDSKTRPQLVSLIV